MTDLEGMCDVAIGNEEDADKVFGIQAPEANVTTGQVEADQYRCVCEQLAQRFHRLKTIAITLRGPLSTSHNTWSGVLWDKGEFYTAPTYDILSIVDRVGGLIYSLRKYAGDSEKALRFAVAASCLKHSIPGDLNAVTVAEVEQP
jgi:2-dehydro-3-deoxygluconokinase